MVGFGAALLQMFLALLELEALRTIVSVAIVLLALATMLAAFLPSVAAGLIFALAAVYGGINMIWMAWLAAAIAVAGFVVFGIFLVPSESSAVILPDVRSARQALIAVRDPRRAGGHSGQPVLVARETAASC